ncbi:pinensin family lanthipeptide [Roseivirga sp. BDSF3-8]|uniref:pinensin family lanthipeptide n=1 Tax=Roseivirga sp. BDSF3-8 TaxID=3241598 RepID=UPI003531D2A2
MKKKQLTLNELKVKSFTTADSRHVRGGLERIAEVDGSIANCETDCIGRYCDPA